MTHLKTCKRCHSTFRTRMKFKRICDNCSCRKENVKQNIRKAIRMHGKRGIEIHDTIKASQSSHVWSEERQKIYIAVEDLPL